jgi:hypothetical protein
MTPNSDRPDRAVSIAEIAELTARLRKLSAEGARADQAELAAFLADKHALLDRITDPDTRPTGRARVDARDALAEVVMARAADHGYVLVGPSARTWLRDPLTGRPTRESSEAEHQTVRALLGQAALDATEPEPVTTPDGRTDLHAVVAVPVEHADHARTAAGVDAVAVAGAGAARTQCGPAAAGDEGEARREQLTRWHHDDHPDGHDVRAADVGDAVQQDATDHADDGDGAGWDR